MKEINLREFYPEIYKTDLFISLPDEVVDVLVEYQRKEVAYRRRTYRHKAYLSLDYGDDIEREAVLFTPTLQEIVERHLEDERLYQAISSLPEKQRQRVYAHYILGIISGCLWRITINVEILSKRKSWFSKNSYWENLNCVFMTFISTMEQQERISTVTASNGCFRILNPAKWAV